MFYEMRQSDCYSFKRYSTKIQYEVLYMGLQHSIIDICQQHADDKFFTCDEEKYKGINYYQFATHFVNNKYNLKDVMMQIAVLDDDSEYKLKEEYFLLLSLFLLTYEYRTYKIQMIIYQNKENFY